MSDEKLPTTRAESERYIRVQPAATSLTADQVTKQAKRLHSIGRNQVSESFTERLARTFDIGDPPPCFECLLVTKGGESSPIQYYFGVDAGDEGLLDSLEQTLRVAFPGAYEIEQVQWSPVHAGIGQASEEQYAAGIEYVGVGKRRRDWQARLTPFTREHVESTDESTGERNEGPRSPLTSIIETMASTPLPAVYQVLFRPMSDWSGDASDYRAEIETQTDTIIGKLSGGRRDNRDETALSSAREERLRQIIDRDTRHSFTLNARVAVLAPRNEQTQANKIVDSLQSALSSLSGDYHWIEGRVRTDSDRSLRGTAAGQQLLEDIRNRRFHEADYQRLGTHNPVATNDSRGIVVDRYELPQFCAIDGSRLSPDAMRALETVPQRQTSVPRPANRALEPFRTDGLSIGRPLTHDGNPTEPIAIPPAQQTRHAAWFGQTGSGKSTGLINAILDNHQATDGPEILVDRKGGRMATEYMQAHYARYGDLEDVYYFDCAEWLPAVSFFDIRGELEAGVPREVAVEDRIGHFDELLAGIMGPEQYRSAIRAPAVIKNVLEALYDPVHGEDVFAIDDLLGQLQRMHRRQTPPAVSDDSLQQRLESDIPNGDWQTFEKVMNGAKNRVEALMQSAHLRRLFQYAPDDEPSFDLRALLDEDAVVIIDVGDLRTETRRGITLAVLSQLWTALRRRHRRGEKRDQPLANLYLEEAADIASTDLVAQLLQQAREFDCAMTLAMQFPGQLQSADEDAYRELLNNVGTYVVGAVGLDHDLAHRLATSEMDKEAVANRLRGLSPGEWLVSLPGQFFERNPAPFVCQSLELPRGHPDSDHPTPDGVASAQEHCRGRTRHQRGIELERPAVAETTTDDEEIPASLVQSKTPILAWTTRLPDPVDYFPTDDKLECTECNLNYDATADGMEATIECCHSLGTIDRADVPVCDVTLQLDPEEIENSQYTPKQLGFLQVVYDAQQQRHTQLEYDIVWDSMLRLKEYVGISDDAIDELQADELLTETSHPHRLYSVTADGRDVLDVDYSYGSEYGHGAGDLSETSQHACGVEVTRRQLQERVHDPADPLAEVSPYYELGEHELSAAAFMGGAEDVAAETDAFDDHRLDLVGLDADGEIILTVEVERLNHDLRRAAPEDYDKMAACKPEEALWVPMSHTEGHEILDALRDPLEGEPRVEKSYADSTPVSEFRIDEPGFTKMRTIEQLRGELEEP